MNYTIGEVSKKTGLSTHTLRYYEKEGLLHFIKRNDSGLREYSENDIELLKVINCLKDTGMTINNIKNYVDLCQAGNSTIQERKEIFIKQKSLIEEEMEKLNQHLETTKYKIRYYDEMKKNLSSDETGKKLNCENVK